MRRAIFLLLLILLAIPTRARAQQSPDLAPILRNLASPDFPTRDSAQKQLNTIPPEQYDSLMALAAAQDDAQIKASLQARGQQMLRELLAKQATAPFRTTAHLTGRIVDSAGKPIAGASISGVSPAWGSELGFCLIQSTTADSQGRFDLPLPFPDLLYNLSVWAHGYGYSLDTSLIVHDRTDMGDLSLTPAPRASVSGILLDQDGKPVPHQKIEILGEAESGGTAITDATGQFTADNLSTIGGSIGQAIPIVQRNDHLTVPVEIIRQPAMANLQLKLVKAAGVSGKVSTTTGDPLPGATVFLRPFFMSGLLLTATTAADGTYHFTDVPPGEFILTAEAPGFIRAAPHTAETQLPRLTLHPGDAATRDLTLEPMAILRGTIRDRAGKPVPDAIVGIISNWRNNYSQQYCAVQTDAAGRYTIATGHTVERTNQSPDTRLIAFSGTQGITYTPVPKLTVGELREVNVTLPGSARLAGTLVDAAGHGIAGIRCLTNATNSMSLISAEGGTFDFGRISLPADPLPLQLKLEAPRPSAPPRSATGSLHAYRIDDPLGPPPSFTQLKDAPTYYAHQDVTVNPDAAATLKVALQPVKLLQFQGTILKPDGTPAANAEVYILTGDANSATWVQSVRPIPMGSSWIPPSRDNALACGKADKDGHFNLFAVREEGTAAILAADKWDCAHFTVGAWLNNQSALTDKFDMPTENKSDFKITLSQ